MATKGIHRNASPNPMPRPAGDATELTFPDAMRAVIDGARVRRLAWEDPSVCIFATDGVLKIRKSDGSLHALLVSDGDLYATDWTVVREH